MSLSLLSSTAAIVSGYVSNNGVTAGALPDLIRSIHGTLSGLGAPVAETAIARNVPAVSVKKSITPDYLISLEDGRRYKSMKRHLAGLGLTPEEYRRKWNLPYDYPMVAPNYAKQRSALAKAIGLGKRS